MLAPGNEIRANPDPLRGCGGLRAISPLDRQARSAVLRRANAAGLPVSPAGQGEQAEQPALP